MTLNKWKLSLYYAGLKEIPNSNISSLQYWTALKAKINEWLAIDDKISFPNIMYVETLISQAWMYRGNSWAHQVRKKDWEPFHTTIEAARVYLLEHKSLKLKDPCWYTSMITIARAQSWDKKRFDKLIEEASTNHPSFYPIYFSAIEYLLPKWHGSTEEIEKFADYAVTKSSSVEGQGMYARIYWYASETQYGHKLFTSSKANWEKMRLGIHDVLARYPDQWNINNFAVFSCLAGDKKTTRSLMGMIEGRPILGPWKKGSFFNSCAQWSGAKLK